MTAPGVPQTSQGSRRRRRLFTLAASGTLVLMLVGSMLWFHFDPMCLPLLTRSVGDPPIPFPAGCTATEGKPPDVVAKLLDHERRERNLVFEKWITCRKSASPVSTANPSWPGLPWLPSYVCCSYQFRRTVVMSATIRFEDGTLVVVAVSKKPWLEYIPQISGQCRGKFSIWK
jgi:hypothetical protein